ncbi:hypothetical protein, partial [Pandoraea sputorum]|uniref:hypothetical protein n=1 Tax=Pandoraea sputorum TaxID=93222 RepID=UPI0035585AFD
VTSTISVAPQLTNDIALHAAEQFTAATVSGASEVIYSSDGRYAYVAGENSISVFTADSLGRLTLTQTLSDASALGSISHMAISGDGKSIYTLSGDNKISLLRAA